MKKSLTIVLIILLCACGANTTQKVNGTEAVININELDKLDQFANKYEFHKDKEVKVYSISTHLPGNENPRYVLYIYRKGVGQTGRFIFWGHNKYDKASYKWINDNTLKFTLFNSTKNLKDSYTYTFGNEGESLRID